LSLERWASVSKLTLPEPIVWEVKRESDVRNSPGGGGAIADSLDSEVDSMLAVEANLESKITF